MYGFIGAVLRSDVTTGRDQLVENTIYCRSQLIELKGWGCMNHVRPAGEHSTSHSVGVNSLTRVLKASKVQNSGCPSRCLPCSAQMGRAISLFWYRILTTVDLCSMTSFSFIINRLETYNVLTENRYLTGKASIVPVVHCYRIWVSRTVRRLSMR